MIVQPVLVVIVNNVASVLDPASNKSLSSRTTTETWDIATELDFEVVDKFPEALEYLEVESDKESTLEDDVSTSGDKVSEDVTDAIVLDSFVEADWT